MKKEGKKWAKGKYPSTSAGSMRRLLTTGVTVPFPVSTISNNFSLPSPRVRQKTAAASLGGRVALEMRLYRNLFKF